MTLCDSCNARLAKIYMCSRCCSAAYCNTQCQRDQWQSHKKACKVVLIRNEEIISRTLYALPHVDLCKWTLLHRETIWWAVEQAFSLLSRPRAPFETLFLDLVPNVAGTCKRRFQLASAAIVDLRLMGAKADMCAQLERWPAESLVYTLGFGPLVHTLKRTRLPIQDGDATRLRVRNWIELLTWSINGGLDVLKLISRIERNPTVNRRLRALYTTKEERWAFLTREADIIVYIKPQSARTRSGFEVMAEDEKGVPHSIG